MKYPVTRFKSLDVALKELEPFIRDGEHLQTGKPFEQLHGMRSREALANWLICVAANSDDGTDRLSFTSDPTGGDGVIYDSRTETTWKTEHVMVPRLRSPEAAEAAEQIETRVIEAVALKQGKGAPYASGKQLVVFLNSGCDSWFPNKVARQLPQPMHFDDVWVVGLQYVDGDEYVYGVTLLDITAGNAPAWRIRIGRNFDGWTVDRIQ